MSSQNILTLKRSASVTVTAISQNEDHQILIRKVAFFKNDLLTSSLRTLSHCVRWFKSLRLYLRGGNII